MRVLGIETSCDETAVAIYESNAGLLQHLVHSQVMHHEYGGVVPELASRDHIRKLLPIVKEVLQAAKLTFADIDGIAYTQGPGLFGALLVGASFARALAYSLNIPSLAIHHLEGHLLAPFLEKTVPTFPFIALLVSGGHSQLMQVNAVGDYQLLGQSIDDAAGEAFDKVAKLLGLEYPGGAALAKLAESGDPKKYPFPRPLLNRDDLNFSFSGLKTAVLRVWQSSSKTEQNKADIAASFQEAVVDVLVKKSIKVLQGSQTKNLVVAGGVGANQLLRKRLNTASKELNFQVFYPRLEFCTDNAAMIAYAGWYRMQKGERDNDLSIRVKARFELAINRS